MRWIIVVLLFLSIGCVQTKEDMAFDTNVTSIDLINDSTQYNKLIVNRGASISDAYQIDSAWIIDNWLNVRVSYSGGCKFHHFNAYYGGSSVYTEWPIIDILLTHQANGDLCEAYVTQELTINLNWLTNTDWSQSEFSVILQNGSNEQYYSTK
jgi:hypothetical protein